MNHSDRQLLRILLSLPAGKLTASEKKAFQSMFDNLENGKVIGLGRKQRSWAESVYMKHELHRKPLAKLKNIKTKDKNPGVKPLDFGPLPLKPPGKS